MPLFLRALFQLLNNWRAVVAFAAVVMATGFSGKIFVAQLGESASKFWWIALLAALVILAREYIREYFGLKREQMRQARK